MSPIVKFCMSSLSKTSVLAMLTVILVPVYGQAQIPRNTQGRPNLSGIWQALGRS